MTALKEKGRPAERATSQESAGEANDLKVTAWVHAAGRWKDREGRAYYRRRSGAWWLRQYKRAGVA